MIGFSIDLSLESALMKKYIDEMHGAGFKSVFTTINIPEDDSKEYYKDRLTILGKQCKKYDMTIMLSVSKQSLKETKIDLEDIEFLKSIGINGIRVTKETTNERIAEISEHFRVGISASHTTKEDIKKLKELGCDLSKLEAWFNYYSREDTGLSIDYMRDKIKFWKKRGIETVAFSPGDSTEEVMNEYVTLEQNRGRSPLYSIIDLIEDAGVDSCYVGDSPISEKTYQVKEYSFNKIIPLYIDVLDEETFELVKGVHKNCKDEAENVVRFDKKIEGIEIVDRYLVSRPKGSLTIDNHRYGRFMGEVQITKKDLALDRRVTVIGRVREEDLELVDKIHGKTGFELIENN